MKLIGEKRRISQKKVTNVIIFDLRLEFSAQIR